MVTVRMMEVALHQVVGVIAMPDRFVSAIVPVFVVPLVRSAIVYWSTQFRVLPAYADLVFVNIVTVRMVQMPIMKVIFITFVLQNRMSAVRTMHTRVRFVDVLIGAHLILPGRLLQASIRSVQSPQRGLVRSNELQTTRNKRTFGRSKRASKAGQRPFPYSTERQSLVRAYDYQGDSV